MISEKYYNSISDEEKENQNRYAQMVKSVLSSRILDRTPLAYIHTFGCQGNVSDSERIKGILETVGYQFTDVIDDADIVLFNTCAIREHAQDRVFGNVGRLKALKAEKPELLIAVCGCMVQQEQIAQKFKKSYPFVDLVFGTHVLYKIPQLLYKALCSGKSVYDISNENLSILEDTEIYRDSKIRAWLPVTYGCDNYCSYCIVPYVRGRERSRSSKAIMAEAKDIISKGYKDITLLGQNVNSYGKGLDEDINFAELLKKLNQLDGDFTIRFMTSHPKDCTTELLDVMAQSEKVAKHLHLPVQSGNDRILSLMNRRYDREKYLSLIDYARKVMPDISVTSDIIVGFPGETYEEFCDTLSLVETLKFTSLFTFIFSPREGTKAFSMDDPISRGEKGKWFKQLTDLQDSIAKKRTTSMKDKTYRVLAEEIGKQGEGYISGRTSGNVVIEFEGSENLIGTFCNVKVTEPLNWIVKGELI